MKQLHFNSRELSASNYLYKLRELWRCNNENSTKEQVNTSKAIAFCRRRGNTVHELFFSHMLKSTNQEISDSMATSSSHSWPKNSTIYCCQQKLNGRKRSPWRGLGRTWTIKAKHHLKTNNKTFKPFMRRVIKFITCLTDEHFSVEISTGFGSVWKNVFYSKVLCNCQQNSSWKNKVNSASC